jgi:exodeoxyribonuclease VII large subunit
MPASSSIWTVSELTGYIKELFEIDFRLQDVEVEGEISNFVRARSGHLYFTLKDEQAQLKCVMWRGQAERLRSLPADGDAVLVQGRISVYEAGGVYQLYAHFLQPAGRGELAIAFERLKAQLAGEGLFDPERKQPIPALPTKIGIVTSADGAALRDILHVLSRRCPLVSVLIAPTLVQGEQAPPGIVRALQWLDGRRDIDTIIVARGGGSMEDLWAFNDERVARAIYAAQHPVISGVGHETDFTIADFVADLRAPTPSAAAELAVPDLTEMPLLLADYAARLQALIANRLKANRQQVEAQMRSLALLSPRATLDNNRQYIDNFAYRLDQALRRRLEQAHTRLAVLRAGLEAVSPQATLARGYAIVRSNDGQLVRSVAQVEPGDTIEVQVSDGHFGAEVS